MAMSPGLERDAPAVLLEDRRPAELEAELVEPALDLLDEGLGAAHDVRGGDDLEDRHVVDDGALEVAAEGHAVERVDLERDEAARDVRTPGVQVDGAAELVDVGDTTGEAGHAASFGRRTRCDPDHIRPEGGPGHIPLPASVRPGAAAADGPRPG